MKKKSDSIFSNWIVRNLLIAAVVVAAILLAANLVLSVLTQHGRQLEVPDFSGKTLAQAARVADFTGVRLEVVDSIYVKRMPRGSVVRQEPRPGAKVKKGRRIQLTINAVSPKKIPMPALVGYSLRSAKAEMESRGLELGRLYYIEDMATNNVLRQIYCGSEIRPGAMLPSESTVDLVLGLNPSDNLTSVPSVRGMKLRSASDAIKESSLNLGKVIYDKEIRSYQDSLDAVVYYQNPAPEAGAVLMGRYVTIYLTTDENKLLPRNEE